MMLKECFHAASAQTIGCWISNIMNESGIDANIFRLSANSTGISIVITIILLQF